MFVKVCQNSKTGERFFWLVPQAACVKDFIQREDYLGGRGEGWGGEGSRGVGLSPEVRVVRQLQICAWNRGVKG